MRTPAVLAALCLVVSGCGAPQELPKQAEDVASVAAEGALLAHDAAEGDTTGPFRRVHAQALRERLERARRGIENPRLASIATTVAEELRDLERGDSNAAVIERALERAAERANAFAQ